MIFSFPKKINTIFLIIITSYTAIGQQPFAPDYPLDLPYYDFVHYKKNIIKFPGDSLAFERFFNGYDSINFKGEGRLNVVHLGGSHIQADIYTHRLRQRLQHVMPGGNGGRGVLFPYRMAKTNNPANYKGMFTGEWQTRRSVQNINNLKLGLTGITGRTTDKEATITIILNIDSLEHYDFNRVRVYHEIDTQSYMVIPSPIHNVNSMWVNEELGYSEFTLRDYTDTLKLQMLQIDSTQHYFQLYGIELLTDDPGLVYHAIGINGASLPSYLKSELFVPHLKAVQPDMVVISIGTNDGNTRRFDRDVYKQNYDTLIQNILKAAPNTALLLTVPNDSYLYRKYINKNTAKIQQVIYELAEEYNAGIWDFYEIMGGLNSIFVWYRFGLARYDKIHFTWKGYMFKADLLHNAILKAYGQHLEKQKTVGKGHAWGRE
ncbi:MAG: GDSL-type esterase/lipase family protein [Bacteroidota bacterium]